MTSKFEQREGQGVLFVNTKKKTPNHPDYTGSFKCDRDYRKGEEVPFSVWRKETKYNHLLSMRVNNYKKEEYPKPVVADENEVPF